VEVCTVAQVVGMIRAERDFEHPTESGAADHAWQIEGQRAHPVPSLGAAGDGANSAGQAGGSRFHVGDVTPAPMGSARPLCQVPRSASKNASRP